MPCRNQNRGHSSFPILCHRCSDGFCQGKPKFVLWLISFFEIQIVEYAKQRGMYKRIDVIKQYSFEYLLYAAYEANGSIAGHIFFVSIFENWAHMAQLPL